MIFNLFRMMQGMQGDPHHAYQSHHDNVLSTGVALASISN